ncbi:GNAT family N-acetyltransferase [Glaciihabitans sp. dw_435]|uniref:GNAT family N-acetyltransferase n=1 Tax=Glaciihabitans sp. dw_435 TaxID=2720081 RepID=UPI001BD385DF|nr:GNAT family N-acetyltransferase [Glaciihabitans sp. dw_435]
MSFHRVSGPDIDHLRSFLRDSDLTLAGLDDDAVRVWVERDTDGTIVGSTGFELSSGGEHALIRSVAVAPDRRAAGAGSRLALFALEQAARADAERAWLFSRRSGPFWQKLGFTSADRHRLAAALPDTRQVCLFIETGQLDREIAWSRTLIDLSNKNEPISTSKSSLERSSTC